MAKQADRHAARTDRGRSGRRANGRQALLPLLLSATPLVGGQAVMEGVMMRNGGVYAIALRQPDGDIAVERRPWFSLTNNPVLRQPFLRGFPILIETLVNGIRALNRSAAVAAKTDDEELSGWSLFLTLCVSLALAVGLFVVAPHLLSLLMKELGMGGDVEGLSFHLWDGLFNFIIFISYIVFITLVPDIRRVFRYHGAEHKIIHAFESDGEISAEAAARFSRLHPRCGTTFLLFVLSIAIILHTVLVPAFLMFWTPEGAPAKHAATLCFKLALMIPISALAYELIRYAARLEGSVLGPILRAPGMFLQLLTTWEPDREQLEVAVAALAGALGPETPPRLKMPPRVFFS